MGNDYQSDADRLADLARYVFQYGAVGIVWAEETGEVVVYYRSPRGQQIGCRVGIGRVREACEREPSEVATLAHVLSQEALQQYHATADVL